MDKTFNKLIKTNIILAVLSVFAVVIMIGGLSYALFFQKIESKTGAAFQIGNLEAGLSSSTGMIVLSDIFPTSASEIGDDNLYSFTLTNSGDYPLDYTIYLSDNTAQYKAAHSEYSSYTALSTSQYQYIDYKLDGEAVSNLGNIYNSSTKRMVLLTGTIAGGGTIETHTIQFWLDNGDMTSSGAPNSVAGKMLAVNINLEGVAKGVNDVASRIRSVSRTTSLDFAQVLSSYVPGENFIVNHIYDGYTNIEHQTSCDDYGECTHEFTYNAITKQWEAPTEHEAAAKLKFSINENKENMAICYDSGYGRSSYIYFYKNGRYYFDENRKRISCIRIGNIKTTDTLSFEAYSLAEDPNLNKFNFYLVDDYTINDSESGVYTMADDYGKSYYFRGDVENNYVKFGDFFWRIVRLNGDGTLRIVYDGTTSHPNGDRSTDRALEQKAFITNAYNYNAYVGYMYGDINGATYEEVHRSTKSSISSTIKTYLDGWYETNIRDKGLAGYVSDTLFCNDRSIVPEDSSKEPGTGIGRSYTFYGAYERLVKNNNPSLVCPQGNDMFTVESKTINNKTTNGALTYPIGLLTADEYVLAGGKWGTSTFNSYLSKPGINWRLGSPHHTAVEFNVDSSRLSYYGNNGTNAAVPVINLSAEAVKQLSGSGTMDDPYHF